MGNEEGIRAMLQNRVVLLQGEIENNNMRINSINNIVDYVQSLDEERKIKEHSLKSAELGWPYRSKEDIEMQETNKLRNLKRSERQHLLRRKLQELGVSLSLKDGGEEFIPSCYKINNRKKIRTELHTLMDLVREKKVVKISDAAKRLKMDERSILRFVGILESKKLVKFNRKVMGEPVILIGEAFLQKGKKLVVREEPVMPLDQSAMQIDRSIIPMGGPIPQTGRKPLA